MARSFLGCRAALPAITAAARRLLPHPDEAVDTAAVEAATMADKTAALFPGRERGARTR
jgi:hypothetical protein